MLYEELLIQIIYSEDLIRLQRFNKTYRRYGYRSSLLPVGRKGENNGRFPGLHFLTLIPSQQYQPVD